MLKKKTRKFWDKKKGKTNEREREKKETLLISLYFPFPSFFSRDLDMNSVFITPVSN